MNSNKGQDYGCCEPLCSLTVTSPIGDIVIKSCKTGLHTVKQCASDDTTFNPVESCPVEIKSKPSKLKSKDEAYDFAYGCVEWLQNYFIHRIAKIDIPPLCPAALCKGTFRRQAWSLLPKAVPFGSRMTYAQLAELCGNRQASRAAGQAMATNPISLLIPCHRVIPSNGGIGNYHHGKKNLIKVWLLDFEESKKQA